MNSVIIDGRKLDMWPVHGWRNSIRAKNERPNKAFSLMYFFVVPDFIHALD